MSGWDARVSRAFQFEPGHVGGRIDSAQPLRRNSGTVRRPLIGSAYYSCVFLNKPYTTVNGYPNAEALFENATGDYEFISGAFTVTVTLKDASAPSVYIWVNAGDVAPSPQAATYLGNRQWAATFAGAPAYTWAVLAPKTNPGNATYWELESVRVCPGGIPPTEGGPITPPDGGSDAIAATLELSTFRDSDVNVWNAFTVVHGAVGTGCIASPPPV